MTDTTVSTEVLDGFLQVGVPTVVDILDYEYGFRGYMSHEIKPIFKTRITGVAVTLKEIACAGEQPDGLIHLFEAVDACGPRSVFVANNEGNKTISLMGDLVAAALHARGAASAILDGAVRDIEPMIQMGFPVFAASVSPVNCTGKTVTVGCNIPMMCGGVQVTPGDVILADWDGVVVIPSAWAGAVLAKAQATEDAERKLVARIKAEAATRRLADIFADAEGH